MTSDYIILNLKSKLELLMQLSAAAKYMYAFITINLIPFYTTYVSYSKVQNTTDNKPEEHCM